MPPRVNSSTATRNAQKYTTLPYPRGCLASGARLASFMPNSSSTWLPQSAAEWIASASIALEPVTAAATPLAIRIPLLAPSAYSTARIVEACDMNSPLSQKNFATEDTEDTEEKQKRRKENWVYKGVTVREPVPLTFTAMD